MLTLPVRVSNAIPNITDRRGAERIITDMTYEALSKLSRWKPDGYTEESELETRDNDVILLNCKS